MTELGVAPSSAFGTLSVLPLRDPTSSATSDWTPQLVLPGRHVPGSPTTIRQNMGTGPLTVTWLVRLASDTDYQTFIGMLGTTATFRVLAEATAAPGDRQIVYGSDAYKEFDNVILTAITAPSSVAMRRMDGTVLCLATFERDQA